MVKFPSPLSPTLLSVKLLPVTIYSVFLQKSALRQCRGTASVSDLWREIPGSVILIQLILVFQSEVFRILPSRLRRKIFHLGFSYLFISVCSVYTNWEPHPSSILHSTLSIDLIRVQSPSNSHLTYQIWNWIPIPGQYLWNPSTNNWLSHRYLFGSENLGANHICTSQQMMRVKMQPVEWYSGLIPHNCW